MKIEFCEIDDLDHEYDTDSSCSKLHLRVKDGEVYRGNNHFLMIDLPNYDEKEAEEYRKAIMQKLRTIHSQPNVEDDKKRTLKYKNLRT